MRHLYEHIHKYERCRLGSFKKSGHEIYKCVIPGCPHYMIDMEAVVGRLSQCWGEDCTNEVEMTRFIVFSEKRKRPICSSCKEERRFKRLSKRLGRIEPLITRSEEREYGV